MVGEDVFPLLFHFSHPFVLLRLYTVEHASASSTSGSDVAIAGARSDTSGGLHFVDCGRREDIFVGIFVLVVLVANARALSSEHRVQTEKERHIRHQHQHHADDEYYHNLYHDGVARFVFTFAISKKGVHAILINNIFHLLIVANYVRVAFSRDDIGFGVVALSVVDVGGSVRFREVQCTRTNTTATSIVEITKNKTDVQAEQYGDNCSE